MTMGGQSGYVVVVTKQQHRDEPGASSLKLAVSDHFRIIYLVLGFPTRHLLSIMVGWLHSTPLVPARDGPGSG